MPVPRTTNDRALVCGLLLVLLVGCRGEAPICPEASVTANPQEIPDGVNQTDLFVEVSDPFPQHGLAVVTEITTIDGTVADSSARETTFVCAHDVSGPAEICVNATYLDPMGQKSEDPNVGASYEYLGTPHVRLPDPLECSETRCMVVTCPEIKNECPVVSSLTVEPMDARETGTATIEVVAEGPKSLIESLSAQDLEAVVYLEGLEAGRHDVIPIVRVRRPGDLSLIRVLSVQPEEITAQIE